MRQCFIPIIMSFRFLCIIFYFIMVFLKCKEKHCIKCINVFQRKNVCFWFSLNMFPDDAKYFVCSWEQSAHWVDDFRKLPESTKYSSWILTSTLKFTIFNIWFMFHYLLFTHINYHLAFLYSVLEFTGLMGFLTINVTFNCLKDLSNICKLEYLITHSLSQGHLWKYWIKNAHITDLWGFILFFLLKRDLKLSCVLPLMLPSY